ncbi:polysaccharide deacetylase family protein [Bradyrhizobium sp.]|uniref:polysaccharide deacetylase family protein n=1 Tax=Bradyrhizobium sp. TaxID=376 RepID=UPI0025BDD86E|nr:polysaccharide deacetylase family protein [Bradyrhizobium sp.]
MAGVPRRIAVCLGLFACMTAQAASAAVCSGHGDVLGTSRTLVVDPREHRRIGTMQYAETLPLADGEVVLTFDDGPLPGYSDRILEILASQCVKATFFMVGSQARANPEGVRKVRDGGHTVATHSQNHPAGMHLLPIDRVRREIDEGIASVSAALGDGISPAPFFRVPGLRRAEGIEQYAASKGAQVWSADFLADDWRHVSSARVYELAMRRLEAKGKGILLLHDIQARTVAALPKILQAMKARGYRIVHVVPATAELAATPTEPSQWRLHPPPENAAILRWPKIPSFVFAGNGTLPGPWLSDSYWNDEWLTPSDRGNRRTGAASLPRQAPWPRQVPLPLPSAANLHPVPGRSIFEFRDRPRLSARAVTLLPSRRAALMVSARHGAAQAPAEASASRRKLAGKSRIGGASAPGER